MMVAFKFQYVFREHHKGKIRVFTNEAGIKIIKMGGATYGEAA